MTSSKRLRLAVVTDIHHGPDVLTKKGSAALGLLSHFVHFCKHHRPDMVIDLGDRVNNESPEADQRRLLEVAREFKKITAPRMHLMGNHDLACLSRDENQSALDMPAHSTSLDIHGWHLVFWQAETANYWPNGCQASDCDLEWLREDLASTSLSSLVFTHLPLDAASMTGNFYFHSNPRLARYGNDAQIRSILDDSGKVKLCLAGHTHWNRWQAVNGITYVSLPSLTESFMTPPEPAGAWSLIDIEPHQTTIQVIGLEPMHTTITLSPKSTPWIKPLPPLDQGSAEPSHIEATTSLANIRAVLFDLDGVFYAGDQPLPGGAKILSYLRENKVPFMAITNNARKSPAFYAQRLASMGVDFPAERIVTSAQVAAEVVADQQPDAVFVVGSSWLHECVLAHGLRIDAAQAQVVIAGMDETVTLAELDQACLLIRDGAKLVVTNPDQSLPTPRGRIPSGGALRAYLETATGQQAMIIGKPEPHMFERALQHMSVAACQTLMVGDTVETDIIGAKKAGLMSAYLGSASDLSLSVSAVAANLSQLADIMSQQIYCP
jgi:HAD superfamily hydrolase (TIGR01450 family)